MKKFSRSEHLPFPQQYFTSEGKNPILTCLLDQINQHQELSRKYPNQIALFTKIIEMLETGRIRFPSSFNLISSEKWCKKMRANPNFYFLSADSFSMIREYENLLLDLAAQCLDRKVQVIPFLQQDEGYFPKIFPSNWFSRLKSIFFEDTITFHIMFSQKIGYEKSFFSIDKQSLQDTPESAELTFQQMISPTQKHD